MTLDLVGLIRGEGGAALWPSGRERQLLKFALDIFGKPLSQFLLAGLGAEDTARSWLFTVTFTDKQGIERSRQIKVEADNLPDLVPGLPQQREPLVLLALLRLLIVDRQLSSAPLFYEHGEVLSLLGWEDAPGSQLAIDKTVKRYATLSYDWGLSDEELAERKLSFYQGQRRIVSGYSHYSEEEDGQFKRVAGRVNFATELIEELVGRRLFNIEWGGVREIALRVVD